MVVDVVSSLSLSGAVVTASSSVLLVLSVASVFSVLSDASSSDSVVVVSVSGSVSGSVVASVVSSPDDSVSRFGSFKEVLRHILQFLFACLVKIVSL